MNLDGFVEWGEWYQSSTEAANALLDAFVAWAATQPLYRDALAALDRIDRALGSERALTVVEYQAACGAATWLARVMQEHGFPDLAHVFSTVSRRFPVLL